MLQLDLHHPSPQFRRDTWLSLDGEWTMNGSPIRVPYPPEAALSRWQGEAHGSFSYARDFSLPEGFLPEGWRLLLHFGAVDQEAYVFVNSRPAVRHEGGYLPFEADITELLVPGENRLNVEAVDTLSHDYPYGKQRAKPGGMWYTPFSGIWKTVWLEAVPPRRVRSLRITPDLTGAVLEVEADGDVRALLRAPTGEETDCGVLPGPVTRVAVKDPQLWSPDRPALYGLTLQCGEDRVESYFALRTVGVLPDASGIPRLCLNGDPVFLCGLLDQGYFPDGLAQPASPGVFADDMRRLRALGFNCDRKHVKVESEAFYCACDAAGVLVIQDMVQSGRYRYVRDTVLANLGLQRHLDCLPGRRERRAFFERHCLDTVAALYNHPCVIAWTLFNEGWGQYDTTRLYRMLKKADPTRLVDSASGWYRGYETDLDSRHVYFRNRRLRPGKKPMLLSECGGYTRAVQGHMAEAAPYGYGAAESAGALADRMEAMADTMLRPAVPEGLCGYIYVQLTDVEGEINGLYTWDREVCKADETRLRQLNRSLRDELESAARMPRAD